MNQILYINACVRENSRTHRLARFFLGKLEGTVDEVRLSHETLHSLDAALLAKRDKCIKRRTYDDPMFDHAKRFASADLIVVAAPYWDLSFPAILKIYLESICVDGITYRYDRGTPMGLCRAKRLVYITTSGGIIDYDLGYNYVKTLSRIFFGINETVRFSAEDLDFGDASVEILMNEVKAKMERYLMRAYDLRLKMLPQ
ncbi:MAG: NAD(P)H-dependent oxidoreductase [Clostridia bacterium]|nr:NAD(P)H-dependent oxidoreductase [Clostridia bacterium]